MISHTNATKAKQTLGKLLLMMKLEYATLSVPESKPFFNSEFQFLFTTIIQNNQ